MPRVYLRLPRAPPRVLLRLGPETDREFRNWYFCHRISPAPHRPVSQKRGAFQYSVPVMLGRAGAPSHLKGCMKTLCCASRIVLTSTRCAMASAHRLCLGAAEQAQEQRFVPGNLVGERTEELRPEQGRDSGTSRYARSAWNRRAGCGVCRRRGLDATLAADERYGESFSAANARSDGVGLGGAYLFMQLVSCRRNFQVSAGIVSCCKDPVVDALGFERAEEAFHRGIVPAVNFFRMDVTYDTPTLARKSSMGVRQVDGGSASW